MTRKQAYTVYILRCSDGTLYIGKTFDVVHRLKQHNGELKGGAKYTAGRRPVQILYTENYQTHKEAAQREYTLKKLTREQKQQLINTINTTARV